MTLLLHVQLKRALKGRGQLQIVWDSTLYHKDDLPFGDVNEMPDVFTPFRNKARLHFSPATCGLLSCSDHLSVHL